MKRTEEIRPDYEIDLNIIRRLSDTVPKLDKEKQSYILGVAEGMVIAKDYHKDKQLQEA